MVIPALGPGGAERIAISIAEEIDATKVEMLVVVLYPYVETIYAREAEEKGLRIIYLNKKRGIDLSIIFKLKKIIKQYNPDVIHTHLYVVAYVLLASPRNIVKYHTVHNVAEKEATGIRRVIMKIAYTIGNFTPVGISPYCVTTIKKIYHLKNFPCICNGIDTNYYKPCKIEHNGIRFINVGRLQSQKNQSLLIKAFAQIHKMFPNTSLEIIGEGELRPELEDMVDRLNIHNSVVMQGISSEILKKLNESDIYVSTSDFEGLPVSVLEAMACGLPVVATKAGGIIDIVRQGYNGFLVEVGDMEGLVEAMTKLVLDTELRSKLGNNSRTLSLEYDIKSCAQKYQSLYLEI